MCAGRALLPDTGLLAEELVKPDAPAAEQPAAKGEYKIVVDTNEAPELEEYGKRIQALGEEWYPIIVAKYPSEGFTPAKEVFITFKKDYRGVAAAGGRRITASVKYFKDKPDDLGAFVHELVHVVQAYRRGPRDGRNPRPGWLVEGIADHFRFFQYEPVTNRPRPNPDRAKHTDSYRTSAHFLNWAQETYDKGLVVKLNTACRESKYSEELWKQYTGKTLEELGAEWKESLRKSK